LLSRKPVTGAAVFTGKPFGVTASRTYKRSYKGITAIQWTTVGAKDTRYSDYVFKFRQNALHEELTWTCIAADLTLCRSTEPTKDSGAIWQLVPFYIVTSVKLITIQEKQEGDLWLKGYPYLQGMYVCSPDESVFRCLNGAKCSTISPGDYSNSEYPYLGFLKTSKICSIKARTPAVFKAAKEWEDLSYFDATTGLYVGAIPVGTLAYDEGRIYESITTNQDNARYYQPSKSSTVKAWKLTAFSATKESTTARTFVKTKPSLAECIADEFNADAKKGTTAIFGSQQSLSSSPNLTVKAGQVCSSDTEMRRKLQAGNAKFTNISKGAITGVTY